MALKELIKNQTIIIDDHKRGIGEVKNWDDKSVDVHIDKTTNFPWNGKRQNIRIKIPINSDRPIKIENARKKELYDIPSKLKREIQKAFENKQKRELFINDIVENIKSFDTILSSEEVVQQVLNNISKHFELKWTEDKISIFTNGVLAQYSQSYTDNDGKEYFISVDTQTIKIGENNGYAKQRKFPKLS